VTGAGETPGPAVPSEPFAVGLLRTMLEIPSPSYGEAKIGSFLVDAMRRLGFTACIDAAGNAVGEITRGEGPTVMLLGHMDTVPGDIPVRSEDNRLYGRGAVDAKGPLAAMVCAAASATGFRGRLVVVGAVEEETALSRGAVLIRRTHARPDALIIGEPSGWQTVVLGYKGKLDLRYRVKCPPTHPSNPAPKASELTAAAWATLLELLGPDAGHGSFDRPGATLVSIVGDSDSAEAEFSVRTPPGFDSGGLVTALHGRLTAGELTVINDVAACRVGRSDPVVRALSVSIRAQRCEPSMKVKTGTSDMNTLAEAWDIPMATYGPGDSRLDHADDEHILLTDYQRGIGVLTGALLELSEHFGRVRQAGPRLALVRDDGGTA
jgi:LysW-gamma-L-lysine carboxypeptidase